MHRVIATYHKDCIDGTAAAAVVLRKFADAKLFPLAHSYTSTDMEPIIAEIDSATVCYTVDCILGAKEFLDAGCVMTSIDHHVGGKEDGERRAAGNSNYTFVFDNEKSGATLAWTHFFPNEPMPELLQYVEDADLWKWKMGETTKDVNNYLSMFRNDPKVMLDLIEGESGVVKTKGAVISQYADAEIRGQLTIPPITLKIGEHRVPAYNVTVYESAVGNKHADEEGQAVALFAIKGSSVKLGFRSKDNHLPTSLDLAKILGGGGHKNAAGAEISLPTFLAMIQS